MTLPANLDHCPARKEASAKSYHVIARPKAVAISWQALQNRTICQEIPTVAPLPRNDGGNRRLVLLTRPGNFHNLLGRVMTLPYNPLRKVVTLVFPPYGLSENRTGAPYCSRCARFGFSIKP